MPTPDRTSTISRSAAAHDAMLGRERAWATRSGRAFDASDQLAQTGDGLCFSPDPQTSARLERHPERPLGEAGKHAVVDQLGSAWALACNVIEAIPEDRMEGLLAALGTGGVAARRSFVHPDGRLESALPGAPVLQIDRDRGAPIFVEVHGAALALDRDGAAHALPRPDEGWGDLEGCRRLAAELAQRGSVVPLASTLRRIRTLCRSHGRRGFRYLVLRPHFDRAFDDILRRAYDGVRMRIGGEVDFDAIDLATLHGRLHTVGGDAHPALGWLADRYLDTAARA